MTNIFTELNAYHRDGSREKFVFTDGDDYKDCLNTRFRLEHNDDVVYISDVTCVEWFRDEIK